MKLQDLAAKPINVELTHPTSGEKLGVTVQVVGKNSKQFKSKFYDTVTMVSQDAKDISQGEKMRLAESRSYELIAACVIGWSDEEFFDGPYTPEKALEIVSSPELSWLKDQLEAAVIEENRFFVA